MIDAARLVGTHDILFITLDTLRFDVAETALARGMPPHLARLLPGGRWELRHTPATFTYAAHQAFFAGFLPTPARPGRHPRLFAARFPGSETTTPATCVFDAPDIVTGLAARGYHTVCVGGTGFFNNRSPLGRVLPALFAESHWSEDMGVTCRHSAANQIACALSSLSRLPTDRRAFLFLNVSALHQPNCIYVEGAVEDTPETQAVALADVDRHLPPLIDALRRRASLLGIICSDHGTAYGEDGYRGHRLAHPSVWNVPYAEFVLPRETDR